MHLYMLYNKNDALGINIENHYYMHNCAVVTKTVMKEIRISHCQHLCAFYGLCHLM